MELRRFGETSGWLRRLECRRLVAFLRGGDEEVARTMLAVFDQVERGYW